VSWAVLHDCGHPDAYLRIGDYGHYYSCDTDNDRMFNEQKSIYDKGYYFVTRAEFKKGRFLAQV